MNPFTAGGAGLAMYAILSAIAFGRFALRIAQINAQQFEYGGQVPARGGKITGRSHKEGGVKFNYEAEGGEMAIIRTKNAPANKPYTITGTHTQIASMLNRLGGGTNFEPGARLRSFAYGNLGESLQPPIFVASSQGLGADGKRFLIR